MQNGAASRCSVFFVSRETFENEFVVCCVIVHETFALQKRVALTIFGILTTFLAFFLVKPSRDSLFPDAH
jgi:hypothetical protein